MFPFLPFSKKKEAEEASVDEDFYAHRDEIAGSKSKTRKSSKTKKNDQQDLLLNEKKRARRRLVGAVALVLGLVIVLPMIFDAEPKSRLDDIDIRIPSREKVLPPSRPMPVREPVKQREVALPKQTEPASTRPVAVKPVAPKLEKTVTPPPKTAAKPMKGKLVVQVIALSNQKKVDAIRARMKRAGIKSYTEKTSNKKGAPIRVRVGPFSSKGEAEATCAKLMMMELGCTIMPN